MLTWFIVAGLILLAVYLLNVLRLAIADDKQRKLTKKKPYSSY